MDAKKLIKTVLTTNNMLSHNGMHTDLIGLVFEYTGNTWEPCEKEQPNSPFIYKLTNWTPDHGRGNDWHGQHYCDVCKSFFGDKTAVKMQNHFNSKYHTKKLKKYKPTDNASQDALDRFNKMYPYWNMQSVEATPVSYELKKVVESKFVYEDK